MQQKEMGLLGSVQRIELVPEPLIEVCHDIEDGVLLCEQLSKMKRYLIADRINMNPGNYSRAMATGNLCVNRLFDFEMTCKNLAPLQVHAKLHGYELVPIKNANRIAELEAELMRLRA